MHQELFVALFGLFVVWLLRLLEAQGLERRETLGKGIHLYGRPIVARSSISHDVWAEAVMPACADDEGAPKVLEMDRKVWLSRADVCALLRARGLLTLLRTRLPHGEAEETAARTLSLRAFRDSVQKACFASDAATDHVLLTVSEDIYAVLRAMGLCGAKDSNGRQICILSSIRRALDEWKNMGPRTLSIYRVLVEQYGLIFGLAPRAPMHWSQTETIVYATTLFGKWEGSVRKEIAALSNASDETSDGPPTWKERAVNFLNAACALESTLEEAVSWRLETQDVPSDLAGFRSRAGCPSSKEKASQAARLPNAECKRVVAEHARLYAARLAESAVMEALSLLKSATSARSIASALCALLRTKASPSACDFRKMRLTWEEDAKGEWHYVGTIEKYCQTFPPSPGVHLGLSGATRWTGGDRGSVIQDDLTHKVVELSRLSHAHERERVVLSQELLDIAPARSNAALDLKYREALKPWSPARPHDPCAEAETHRDIMLRALAVWWGSRGAPQYPDALKAVLQNPSLPFDQALQQCTVQVQLKTALKNVVDALNTFIASYPFKTTNLHRDVDLILTENTAPHWILPLTQDKMRSTGIYYFVVWMICHDRVLNANKVELRGRFLLNDAEVARSSTTYKLK